MSSTKIVIIVLVLVGVLFVIFVVRGVATREPDPKPDQATAKKQKPPDWTKKIEEVFSSLKPKRPLEKKIHSFSKDQPIELRINADDKQAFRTVKFHLMPGSVGANIVYNDDTPVQSEELEELKEQECPLPGPFNPENPKADPTRCSIVALKRGGKAVLNCVGTGACRVEVE